MDEKELGDLIFLILMSVIMIIMFYIPLTIKAIKELKLDIINRRIKKLEKRLKEIEIKEK